MIVSDTWWGLLTLVDGGWQAQSRDGADSSDSNDDLSSAHMADGTTEIDLDSVIDRLLEGACHRVTSAASSLIADLYYQSAGTDQESLSSCRSTRSSTCAQRHAKYSSTSPSYSSSKLP